jgi:hypothetical protein
MIETGELGAALLWLRNHYDVGDPAHKPLVLQVIDEMLNEDCEPNSWVTFRDMRAFREKRLKQVEVPVGQIFVEASIPSHSFNAPLVEKRDLWK